MAYIDREKALEIAKDEYYSDFHKSMADLTSLRELLEDTPAADVVEVRHGKWIGASKKANVGMKCSLCGARIKYSEFFNGNHNYCHKCGAKMDGKDGE